MTDATPTEVTQVSDKTPVVGHTPDGKHIPIIDIDEMTMDAATGKPMRFVQWRCACGYAAPLTTCDPRAFDMTAAELVSFPNAVFGHD